MIPLFMLLLYSIYLDPFEVLSHRLFYNFKKINNVKDAQAAIVFYLM